MGAWTKDGLAHAGVDCGGAAVERGRGGVQRAHREGEFKEDLIEISRDRPKLRTPRGDACALD
eukprot:4174201-Prymnesium_polylepis.1